MSKPQALVDIPEDLSDALQRAAKKQRRPQADLVVEALRQYLGVFDPDAIDRACREINAADREDAELQAVMERVYLENMFESAK